MKILFAVNNEKISKSIIKKYQNEYKEIISYDLPNLIKTYIILMLF